jgi:hypothetical protein
MPYSNENPKDRHQLPGGGVKHDEGGSGHHATFEVGPGAGGLDGPVHGGGHNPHSPGEHATHVEDEPRIPGVHPAPVAPAQPASTPLIRPAIHPQPAAEE